MTAAEKDAVMDRLPPRRDSRCWSAPRWSRWAWTCPMPRLMTIESGRALRPGPAAPVAGPDQPGHVSRLLLRLRRSAEPTTPAAAEGLRRPPPTASNWRRRIFSLRGPGDLFGTKQHGLPPLRIADLLRDAAVVGRGPPRRPGPGGGRPGAVAGGARPAAADDAGPLRQGAGVGRRGVRREGAGGQVRGSGIRGRASPPLAVSHRPAGSAWALP